MAAPTLSLTRSAPSTSDAEVLVLGVCKSDDGPRLATDDPAFAGIQRGARADRDVRVGRRGTPASGTGRRVSDRPRRPRKRRPRRRRPALRGRIRRPPAHRHRAPRDRAARRLERGGRGGARGRRHRRLRRTRATASASLGTTKTPADEITVHVPESLDADDAALVERATAIVAAMHTVRDLVSTPASDLYPETLAAAAVDLAAGLPVEVEVLDEDGTRPRAATAASSASAPGRSARRAWSRCATRPPARPAHLSLVGKGITFDTGGLQVKPASSMISMKYDMTGAVTVLAVIVAAARLGAAGHDHRAHVHRREHGVGIVDAPERRAAHPRRHDRRGAQHRRRGPSGARRRPGRRLARSTRRASSTSRRSPEPRAPRWASATSR